MAKRCYGCRGDGQSKRGGRESLHKSLHNAFRVPEKGKRKGFRFASKPLKSGDEGGIRTLDTLLRRIPA